MNNSNKTYILNYFEAENCPTITRYVQKIKVQLKNLNLYSDILLKCTLRHHIQVNFGYKNSPVDKLPTGLVETYHCKDF